MMTDMLKRSAIVAFVVALLLNWGNTMAQGEINVRVGAIPVASGATYDFGSVNIGSSPVAIFTLENLDVDTLVLTGLPLTASGDYTILAQPANDSLFGVSSLSFAVQFSPSCDGGAKLTSVSIASSDADENPYIINIQGTAVDIEAPNAECFNKDTVYLDAAGDATITTVNIDSATTDNCSILTLGLDTSVFDCGNASTTLPVLLTATDGNSNSNTCQTQVTILDTISPVANCGSATVFLDAFGAGTVLPSEIDNGSTDACGIQTLSLDEPAFTCAELGLNSLILTVEDNHGNTSSCSGSVTVSDTTSPVALCQDVTAYLDVTGNVTVSAFLVDNGSSDGCSIVDGYLDDSTFTCGDLGANAVTLTVEDQSGNTGSCAATITIEDTIAPTMQCTSIIVQLDASGNITIDSNAVDNGTSDACGVDFLALNITDFDCGDVGPNAVIMTAQDDEGNQDTCHATVTVQDNVDPTALCQDVTVALDAGGNATITEAQVDNGSNDACGIASLALDQTAFDCDDVSSPVNVELTVTDDNGNVSTCSADITVEDNDLPVALCKSDTVYLNAFGTGTITPAEIDNGSNDICGIASLALDKTTFDCSDTAGVVTVSLTVTDNSGNVNFCNTATVKVLDTIPPTALCQNVTVQLDALGSGTVTSEQVDAGSDDACGIMSLSLSQTTFDCGDESNPVGVTLTVTDSSGNTNTCAANITVEDNIAPTALCKDTTLYLNAAGTFTSGLDVIDNGSWDSCGIQSYFTTKTAFNCGDVGTPQTVSMFVTDINTNLASCNATITILDTIAPTALCQDVTLFLDAAGSASTTPAEIDNGSSDACTNVTLALDQTDFDCQEITANTVTLTATDDYGNAATCQATVTINDTISPTISCPDTIEVCLPQVVNYTIPSGADNCSGFVVNQSDFSGLTDGSTFPIGTTVQEFTVTDSSGNSNLCSFPIIVYDLPTPAFAGNDTTICDTVFDLLGNAPTIGFGTWRTIAGGSVIADALNNNSQISNVGVGSNQLIWETENGVCPTSDDTVTISRDDYPTVSVTSADFNICGSNTSTITANNPSVGSGLWTRLKGTSTIDNDAFFISNVSVLSVDTNQYAWTISNGVCPPSIDTINVIRDQNPDASAAGTDQFVCDSSDTLNANAPVSGVGSWSLISGTGTFSDINDPNSAVTGMSENANVFRWTITSGSCGSNSDEVTINRSVPLEEVNAGDGPITQCVDTITLSGTVLPAAGTVLWTNVNAPDSVNIVDPNDPKTHVTNLQDGSNIFIYTVTSGICEPQIDFVIIIKDDDLSEAIAGPDVQVCSDSITFLDADVVTAGIGGWTVETGTGVVTTTSDPKSEVTNLSVGTNTFVWTISSLSCTPSIDTVNIFRDGIDPTIICPNDTTVENDSSFCGAIVGYDIPVGLDNCPNPFTTRIAGLDSGAFFPSGVTTQTFEVEDEVGATATCSFDVTVLDTEAPIVTAIDTLIRFAPTGFCERTVTYNDPTATDNCNVDSLVQIDATGLSKDSTFPVGITILAYAAYDSAGNADTSYIYIEVRDIEQPILTCPGDTIMQAADGDCEKAFTYATPTATDNCLVSSITLQAGLSSGSLFPLGATNVGWLALDASGNSDNCQFTVTVTDTSAPVITCVPDIAMSNDSGDCGAIVTFSDPGVFDPCEVPSITQTLGDTSGAFFPLGATINQYVASDVSNNNDTCAFTITISDDELPMIVCPNDITQGVDPGNCDAVVTYNPPAGTDNCSGFGTLQSDLTGLSSGSTFPVGTTTLEYTVTDGSANTATCSFDVNIIDNELPTLACPGDIAIDNGVGTCEAQVFYAAPSGSDNCGIASDLQTDVTGLTSGSNFPVGTTTIEYTTTDQSANTATCTFNITVNDIDAPTIVCHNDTVVSTDLGECGTIVTYIEPVGSDACSPSTTTLQSGIAMGGSYPIGVTTQTYEVVDTAGNSTTCSFTITVEDNEIPIVDCPTDTIISNDPGNCTAVFTFGLPTASDNCSDPVVTQVEGPASGSAFVKDTTVLAFIATDSVGNESDTCFYNVIVIDDEKPALTCPSNIQINNDPGECGAVVTWGAPAFGDNCSIATVTKTDITGLDSTDFFPLGITALEYTVIDSSSNDSVCTFTIEVLDNEAPVFTCPSDTILENDSSSCGAVFVFANPGAVDSCGTTTVSQTFGLVSGTEFPLGVSLVTFEAEDTSGNIATCSYNVTVIDTEVPLIACPSDTVISNDAANCSAVFVFSLPASTDNCSTPVVSQVGGLASGSTFPKDTTTLAFVSIDSVGNESDTCFYNVIVIDDEKPAIACPGDIQVNNDLGLCGATVSWTVPGATDNCGLMSVTKTDISGLDTNSFFALGVTIIEYTALDSAGNDSVCTFNVEVLDAEDPVFVCPNDTVINNDLGSCGAIFTFGSPAAVDSCGSTSIVQTIGLGSGTEFPMGINNLEFEATDDAGNTSTCAYTVNVLDVEAPAIICPADTVISADAGLCSGVFNFALPDAVDNCDSIVVTQVEGPSSGTAFDKDTTILGFAVVDSAGNLGDTCRYMIIVQDNEAPVITCESDTILASNAPGTCEAVVTWNPPATSDNCGLMSVVQTDATGLASGDTFALDTTIVEFTASDSSGNTASCSTVIIVSDTSMPTLVCPADISVNNDLGSCDAVVGYTAPVGIDLCTSAITTQIGGLDSGDVFPKGISTISFESIDEAGNVATCSFDIEVVDGEAPVINCTNSVTISTNVNSCDAVFNYDLPDGTDNCDTALVSLVEGPVSGSTLPTGETLLKFVAVDSTGNQSDTCTMVVTVEDQIDPSIICPSDTALCAPQTLTYADPVVSDNCSTVTFAFTSGIGSGNNFTIGSHDEIFTATDSAGNTATCSMTVTVYDTNFVAIAEGDTSICDTMLGISANSAGSNIGEWNVLSGAGTFGNAFTESTNVQDIATGVNAYTWTITAGDCKSSTDTIEVTRYEEPSNARAGIDTLLCGNETYRLMAQDVTIGQGTWTIFDGVATITDPNADTTDITDLVAGDYGIEWRVSNGVCAEKVDTLYLEVSDLPVVTVTPDTSLLYGEELELLVESDGDDDDYDWTPVLDLDNPTIFNPIADPLDTTLYYVVTTNDVGCEKLDSVQVDVYKDIKLVTAFTPDGDGTNDTWIIRGHRGFPEMDIKIYTQWGQVIFESTGYVEPWDGIFNGNPAPFGAYYFEIDLKNGSARKTGTVTIIR